MRLQWDPDHHPSGAKLTRRAIQLGIRRDILKKFNEEWLIKIQDITEFVHEQYENVKKQDWDNLLVPEERVYVPEDGEICRHIRLDNRTEADENVDQEVMVEGATGGADMVKSPAADSLKWGYLILDIDSFPNDKFWTLPN